MKPSSAALFRPTSLSSETKCNTPAGHGILGQIETRQVPRCFHGGGHATSAALSRARAREESTRSITADIEPTTIVYSAFKAGMIVRYRFQPFVNESLYHVLRALVPPPPQQHLHVPPVQRAALEEGRSSRHEMDAAPEKTEKSLLGESQTKNRLDALKSQHGGSGDRRKSSSPGVQARPGSARHLQSREHPPEVQAKKRRLGGEGHPRRFTVARGR
jgi:hypothetical protein